MRLGREDWNVDESPFGGTADHSSTRRISHHRDLLGNRPRYRCFPLSPTTRLPIGFCLARWYAKRPWDDPLVRLANEDRWHRQYRSSSSLGLAISSNEIERTVEEPPTPPLATPRALGQKLVLRRVRGKVRIGSDLARVHSDPLLISFRDERTRIEPETKATIQVLTLNMTQVMDELAPFAPTNVDDIASGLSGPLLGSNLGHLCDDLWESLQHDHPICQSTVEASVRLLLLRLLTSSGQIDVAQNASPTLSSTQVQHAIGLMRSDMDRPISLDDMAEVAGVSRSHFARSFKESTGSSPHRYLITIRLQRATEMLREGRSIADAAIDCGFADQAHLTRTFKHHFGETPGEWLDSQQLSARPAR